MRRLIVITGAGFSAESGVQTFRNAGGRAMWDIYDVTEVCEISAFNSGYRYRGHENPPFHSISKDGGINLYEMTHDFYNKRRQELATVGPNLGHTSVADWYKRFPGQVVNITTNVDDLLERAGVDYKDILHVHGYLKEMVVERQKGAGRAVIDVGYDEVNIDQYHWCKPNVVFFGENAPAYREMYEMMDSLTNQDMILIIGCSNVVINFFSLLYTPCVYIGAKIAIINKYDAEAAQAAKYPTDAYSRSDIQLYDERGVPHWDKGTVDAFSDPAFIKMIEDHLEGKTSLQSE